MRRRSGPAESSLFSLVALVCLCAPGPLRAQARTPDSTTVILLGTGMPFPDPAAQGPATVVTVGTRIFLFDAGPGVMRQMTAARLPVRQGPVTGVFLTHLHSDHTLGLPDLVFTSWVMGRRRPLRIVGPTGTRVMLDHILAAWQADIDVRTKGLERAAPNGWKVDVRETTGGPVYDSAGVRISAIPVPHGNWKFAFGYRIEAPGKTVVISGDTRLSPALERAAREADILIHEVYPAARLKPEERVGGDLWPSYMRSFHTSDVEVGQLAARAQPRLVVLHHIVRMGGTDEELLAGVRAGGFKGRVVIGHDLDRF